MLRWGPWQGGEEEKKDFWGRATFEMVELDCWTVRQEGHPAHESRAGF